MAATLPDEAAMNNVIAYLDAQPDVPAATTVSGDVGRGEELWSLCTSCHGSEAQGIWALNAPRMSGMDDWYLERQLNNFKAGIRGAHPADHHGEQMAFMARTLADEQTIKDLVAYVNTLRSD